MPIEVGALISVHAQSLYNDRREEDGFLWIVVDEERERRATRHPRVLAKSLATGAHWTWFDDEFEVSDA